MALPKLGIGVTEYKIHVTTTISSIPFSLPAAVKSILL